MQNVDVSAIANLADLTLSLFEDSASKKATSDSDQAVDSWTDLLNRTLSNLGASNEVHQVMRQFDLNPQMMAFVLFALLPALDSRYQDFYSKLANNTEQNVPTVDLLGTLVCSTFQEKNQLNAELRNNSPIFYWEMLRRKGQEFDQSLVLPGHDLVLFLSANAELEKDANGLVVRLQKPAFQFPWDLPEQVPDSKLVTVIGGNEARQEALAYMIGDHFKQAVFLLQQKLLESSGQLQDRFIETLQFVVLNNGILYWQDGVGSLKKYPSLLEPVLNWLALSNTRLVIGENVFDPPPERLQAYVQTIQLVPLTRNQDLLVWKSLGEKALGVSNIDYAKLNHAYYPDFQRIQQTLNRTSQLTAGKAGYQTQDVINAYLGTSPEVLGVLANRVVAETTLADLELPPEVEADLKSLISKHQQAQKKDMDKGFIALLQGDPGTGKTLSAECFANELGLPLYQMNPLPLQEAETLGVQQIRDFFVTAMRNSAVLFFEEATNLFPAKAATTGHQAVITSLLKELENYRGLVLLSKKKEDTLDKGLLSRVLVTVNFKALAPANQKELFFTLLNQAGIKVRNQQELESLFNEVKDQLGANGRQIENVMKNTILAAKPSGSDVDELVVSAHDLVEAIKMERDKKA